VTLAESEQSDVRSVSGTIPEAIADGDNGQYTLNNWGRTEPSQEATYNVV
jgi:hypothetical protein